MSYISIPSDKLHELCRQVIKGIEEDREYEKKLIVLNKVELINNSWSRNRRWFKKPKVNETEVRKIIETTDWGYSWEDPFRDIEFIGNKPMEIALSLSVSCLVSSSISFNVIVSVTDIHWLASRVSPDTIYRIFGDKLR